MNKHEITNLIEHFAPLEFAEKWDCSGWLVETGKQDIEKVMLCLTVTDDIVRQAKEQNCDMIISHHPLFKINCPSEIVSKSLSPSIDIYCAHTNFDRASGGTTDTLISTLGLNQFIVSGSGAEFTRYINYETSIQDFVKKLKLISPHLRFVNNKNVKKLQKIAFCAGSGTEFIQEAYENGADALVTGDLKFHTALDSPIVVFDIGHFESEVISLPVFECIIGNSVEIVYAQEKSPFICE